MEGEVKDQNDGDPAQPTQAVQASPFYDLTLVSMRAVHRSSSTFEDFLLSYGMFHDCVELKDIAKFVPLLSFVEAALYQCDEENEDAVEQTTREAGPPRRTGRPKRKADSAAGGDDDTTSSSSSDSDAEQRAAAASEPEGKAKLGQTAGAGAAAVAAAAAQPIEAPRVMALFKKHRKLAVLASLLLDCALLDSQMLDVLEDGVEYWRIERLTSEPRPALSFELLDRAIKKKSFDYRLLNLLLARLRRRALPIEFTAFLVVSEVLIEIGDDLYDYEGDVLKRSFNVYRGFVQLHRQRAPVVMLEYIAQLEREYAVRLAKLPQQLQQRYQQRCREAMSVPEAGRWVVPSPILDEQAFRVDVRQQEAATQHATRGSR